MRLAFATAEHKDTLHFFIATRVSGSTPYEVGGQEVHFLDLDFTEKPPNDFIELIGTLLDANAQQRRHERVVIAPKASERLGLRAKELVAQIDGSPRKFILRDLSFSGAKILVASVGKFLVGKAAVLKLDLADIGVATLVGAVKTFEDVAGRRDISALGIEFDEDTVPLDFKLRFNQVLSQQR